MTKGRSLSLATYNTCPSDNIPYFTTTDACLPTRHEETATIATITLHPQAWRSATHSLVGVTSAHAHLHTHGLAQMDVSHLILPHRHNQLAQARTSESKCAVTGRFDETVNSKEAVTNSRIFTCRWASVTGSAGQAGCHLDGMHARM